MSVTKTPAPRVRAVNLYTVEQDGQPVAQAMAISQAEAVRLYVESVQQPTMSARLSSPLEARTLAGLPLLQREPVAADDKTADLFEGAPAAPVSPVVGAFVDADWAPSGDPVTVLDGGPASAQEPAAAQPGEPAGCLDAAPTAAEPATASSEEPADSELRRQAIAAARRRGNCAKPVAMYRDPVSGQSWSGRGLKPRWLMAAIEDGRTQDEFLIENQGAQA
jgi:hypothetical protein